MPKTQVKEWKRAVKPDHDREVFTVLRMIRASGKTDREIAALAGISETTLKNWRKGYQHGGTRYPQSLTLRLVAEAAGYVKIWVPTGTQSLANAVPFEDEEPVKTRQKRSRKVPDGKNIIRLPLTSKTKDKARQGSKAAV